MMEFYFKILYPHPEKPATSMSGVRVVLRVTISPRHLAYGFISFVNMTLIIITLLQMLLITRLGHPGQTATMSTLYSLFSTNPFLMSHILSWLQSLSSSWFSEQSLVIHSLLDLAFGVLQTTQ